MVVLERLVFQVHPGQWAALEALEKKFDAVEKQWKFPAKRRFRGSIGSLWDPNTHVVERQWESLAAMEAAFDKAVADAEWQRLVTEIQAITGDFRQELYSPVP